MGVYLTNMTADDLDGDESSWRQTLAAVDVALRSLGVEGAVEVPPRVELPRGSGHQFEEKLIPSMDSFVRLCNEKLDAADAAAFDWCLLIPVDFPGSIEIPIPCSYDDTTVVRSAQRLLSAMRKLALEIELPMAEIPQMCDNLQLTGYFLDLPEDVSKQARWLADTDSAFYTAMYLRAAEHSIRLNCPLFYS